MAITIRRAGVDTYSASVTPPDVTDVWFSRDPLTARDMLRTLRELGCHTTDISDAFYAANPLWLDEVD